MQCVNEHRIPLVSFIIATYNRKAFVCGAIRSILNQKYNNIEIIVIDDCSSDGTLECIRENFKDTVISYRNISNMGPAYSRNIGLGFASGKYIGLLDSDDILHDENHVDIAVRILEDDEKIDIFCCDFHVIDEKNNILTKDSPLNDSIDYIGFSIATAKKKCSDYYLRTLSNAGALVRRAAINKAGPMDVKYRIGWDVEYFLRILAEGGGFLYYYHKPMACYRKHSGAQTANLSKSYEEKIAILYEIAREYPFLKLELKWRIKKRLAVQFISLSDAYRLEKKYLNAVGAGIKAFFCFYPIIGFYALAFLGIFFKKIDDRKLKMLKT